MKFVFLDEATVTRGDVDLAGLRGLGEYIRYDNTRAESDVIARGAGATVLIANKSPITAGVLESLPTVRLICVAATGYNNVDIAAARSRGVRVCNVAGYSTQAVADQTWAFILNLSTRAWQYAADVQAGAWCRAEMFTLLTRPTFELRGKTLGIVGFGAIGQTVAARAGAFGVRVIMCNQRKQNVGGFQYVPIEQLLAESDIISLHCPLTADTKHLINAAAIEKMKPGAMLINMARGPIVDEAALADALNCGRIAAAAVDVLGAEPPGADNPLLTAKNILITPHTAWATLEARQRLINEITENIKAFLTGRSRHIVA